LSAGVGDTFGSESEEATLQQILAKLDNPNDPALFDITDRWNRQLGQIDLVRYRGLVVGLTNAVHTQIVVGGAVIDPRDRNWNLDQAVDSVQVTPIVAAVWDVSDRWARQLGQIDIARVLGVDLAAGNPVIVGLFDALGNRMPAMDVAARPGFVDVIDRWARQLGQVDLARVLGAVLTVANPVITGVYDAAGNRMPSMDAAARPGYVDVIDRAARLVGIIYGNQGQLQQNAGTLELITDVQRWGGTALTGRDISGDLRALIDDSIKGVMRTLGDAGATPTNQTGETVLKRLFDTETFLDELTDALASVGTDTIRISDAGGSITVDGTITPTQTTRTNMTVMPEREDLITYSEVINEAGAGDVEIVAATASQYIKVYSVSYYIDDAVRVGLRFGTGSRFAIRNTAGTFAQTYTHPHVGPVNTALNFRVEGAITGEVSIQYVKEA